MARIELRNSTIRFRDGYSNTAALDDSPVSGATSVDIDTLGVSGVIPVSSRFTIVGSSKVHTVTGSNGNATLEIDLDSGTGNFTISVNGQASGNIAHDANVGTIQTAVDGISGVDPGDFIVSIPTAGEVLVVANPTGAFANTPVTLAASLGSLVGGSPTSSQTDPGGVTNSITFTPAFLTATGIPTDGAAINFGGRSLEIKVGDGNLEFTENREFLYDLDRGKLDTVRQGNDIPMDVALDFVWEHLTAIDGVPTPTISDVLHRRGAASNWVSSSDDSCEPFAIDIEVEYAPPCGDQPTEFITLPDFRWEGLPHNITDSQVSMTGRCNATEALVSRAAA